MKRLCPNCLQHWIPWDDESCGCNPDPARQQWRAQVEADLTMSTLERVKARMEQAERALWREQQGIIRDWFNAAPEPKAIYNVTAPKRW